MKTITIKQPWAHLTCTPRQDNPQLGIKDIENRTWPTKFRGKVLVHAAAKPWTWEAVRNYLSIWAKEVLNSFGFDASWLKQLTTGAIIGSVEIVYCVINHPSIWAEKTDMGRCHPEPLIYNWVLANPIMFPEPIPAKGKLSFWEYENIGTVPDSKGGHDLCVCNLPVKIENQVMSMGDHFRCRYCGSIWYK